MTDLNYNVLFSTNLIEWLTGGPPTATGPGQLQFIDPAATNFIQRFYRVLSP